MERRSVSLDSDDPIWRGFVPLIGTQSGVDITPEKALEVSAVFACIRVLSESVASLPIKVYRKKPDGSREEAIHHPLSGLIVSPNELNTSYEFRETMMTHLNMRGNFYALKEFNGAGELANLPIFNPAKMKVVIEKGDILYKYGDLGKERVFSADEIWHVRGLSTDGLVGLSPITIAREAIGLAKATEAHGSVLFKNNARPGGMLKYPGKLGETAKERLVRGWQSMFSGNNAYKVALLEEGLDYTPVGFSNEDAQFLETRTFQIEDIARIYRVPAVLIGRPDSTSTYASAEQFFLSFVKHTLQPWLARIEQSMNKNLLSKKDQGRYYVEFQLDGLLRGDIKSRYEAYAIAVQNKWMSANEVRQKENMNRIDGGDVYENPNTSSNSNNQTNGDSNA